MIHRIPRRHLTFTTLLALALAVTGCGDTEKLEVLIDAPEGDLPAPDRTGMHVHPTTADAADIAEVSSLVSFIRMQAPLDVAALVEEHVDGAPPDARFLIILTQPVPAYQLVERYANDPKVIAFQLENEPENLEGLGWTPEQYIDWVQQVAPEVRARMGAGQQLVSAATRPMVQSFPTNAQWNDRAIDLGLLDQVDAFAMHIYSEQFEKLPRVEQVTDRVRAAGKGLWVTETGTNDFGDQLSYLRRITEAYSRFGIEPDYWTIYAWRDDELGYSLRMPDGTESPLLVALEDRAG